MRIFLVFTLLTLMAVLFGFQAFATINGPTFGDYRCDSSSGTKDCSFLLLGPDFDNYQTYKARATTYVDTIFDQTDNDFTLDICLSGNSGFVKCQTVHSGYVPSVGWGGQWFTEIDLGNLSVSSWVNVYIHVKNLYSGTSVSAYGRRVSVDSFNANPSNITAEQSSTLTWSAPQAQPGGITVTGTDGTNSGGHSDGQNLVVSPNSTTTYTLSAYGPGGTATNGAFTATSVTTVTVDSPSTATVACVVSRASNGWAISGATCSIAGQSGTTNVDGYKAFDNIVQGSQTLTVTAPGYNDFSETKNITGNYDWLVALTSSGGTCSPVNGTLSGWSACSVSCGGGTQTRTCSGASCGGDASCGGATLSQSCNTQPCGTPSVSGCTNPAATNYNSSATVDNGSCTFVCSGSATQTCSSDQNICGQTSTGTQTRTCDTSTGNWGTFGTCSASTPSNDLCPPPGSHLACQNNACIQVSGSGSNTCSSNADCIPPPSTCNDPNATNYGGPAPCIPPGASSARITANDSTQDITVPSGSSVKITWSSTNATSCDVDNNGTVVWSDTGNTRYATVTTFTRFTISCYSPGGNSTDHVDVNMTASPTSTPPPPPGAGSATRSCTVTVQARPGPSVSITANPNALSWTNSGTTLSWSSSNANFCSASGNWSGGKALSGSQATGVLTSGTYNYTLTCSGNGSASSTATVTVQARPAPSVSITANPNALSWNNSGSTLSWSSSNADSCLASGNWSGAKALSSSQGTGALTPGTYNYTLTCSGNGSASSTAPVTVNPPVPTASSVTYSPPDYCLSGPGGYVAWSYSDPAGSPQTAYEAQITNNGNFSSPFYDSGKLNSSSKVFAIPNGVLQFDMGYKARVRVWNTYDSPSAWSGPTNTFNTPNYAYPDVIAPYQFTWPTLPKPQQNKLIQFTDHTLFGGGNANNRSWSWTFGDGATSTQQNPAHTYTTIGNYTVSETVTDAANQTCGNSQSINVQKPIPVIKEVAPK